MSVDDVYIKACFDPLPPVEQSELDGQASDWNGHSVPSNNDKSSVKAVVAESILTILNGHFK